MRFNYNIIYTRGKNLITADTLSRAPLQNSTEEDTILQKKLNYIFTC